MADGGDGKLDPPPPPGQYPPGHFALKGHNKCVCGRCLKCDEHGQHGNSGPW
jgi:hypothetical protein